MKRPGTTDVGRWWAFLPAADFALLTGAYLPTSIDAEPVCVTVHALVDTLRANGWGDPIESENAA